MGQRSQIYVRYNKGDNKKGLIANYYGWNYGERMISRARHGIEYILDIVKKGYTWYFTDNFNITKISRIFDVNFDMQDVAISSDIIKEWKDDFSDEDFTEFVFKLQDNNDGKLIVDVCEDTVKYAFLDRNASSDNIMDGEAYMCWNDCNEWRESEYLSKKDVRTCENNIKFLTKNVKLMTKEEVEEFINYDYLKDMQ